MSLGLVVLEKKLFTRTPTPQSDDIMSADIKINAEKVYQSIRKRDQKRLSSAQPIASVACLTFHFLKMF